MTSLKSVERSTRLSNETKIVRKVEIEEHCYNTIQLEVEKRFFPSTNTANCCYRLKGRKMFIHCRKKDVTKQDKSFQSEVIFKLIEKLISSVF